MSSSAHIMKNPVCSYKNPIYGLFLVEKKKKIECVFKYFLIWVLIQKERERSTTSFFLQGFSAYLLIWKYLKNIVSFFFFFFIITLV